MIRYALACDSGHEFESWFPSGEAYDEQRKRGLVSCPLCNSLKVEKQIMAPSVNRTDLAPVTASPPEPEPSHPVTIMSGKDAAVREALRNLHRHVAENAENVGERFPEEARRIHDGEIESRSIYGQASPEDARALVEDGIDIMMLPPLPDEKN